MINSKQNLWFTSGYDIACIVSRKSGGSFSPNNTLVEEDFQRTSKLDIEVKEMWRWLVNLSQNFFSSCR
jgi:hypothetical protein